MTHHIQRVAVVTVLLSVCLAVAALADLRIQDFAVDIQADASGELTITEQLTVRFLTPHHGIERFITLSGKTPWGENVKIDLELLDVRFNGEAVPYVSRIRGSERYLRIGDPDRTIQGTYQYSILYRVNRAWLFHEDSLQLYWNVTGNEWRIPIEHASATVSFPDSVDYASVSGISYLGYAGSTQRGPASELLEDGKLYFQSGLLYPREGMTIDVSIPRAMLPIAPPSFLQRVGYFLDANKYAALPLLVFLGMLFLWLKLGKDPRKRVIAPNFAPPRDMHPGAVGVLIDDHIDLRDISAMLVGLAVKGYLSIREPEKGEYIFIKQGASTDELSPAEQSLLTAIFDTPETKERSLTSLEQVFYKSLPTIKSRLIGQLIKEGYYKSNPERTKGFYIGIGLFMLPLAVYLGIQTTSLYLAAAVALSSLVVLAFAPFMPRKTSKGVLKLEEILGLSEYIRKAEVDRMEFHNAPEKGPELFEKLLPYAIALNLTKLWTRQFDGLLTEPPRWYDGGTSMPVFNAIVFSHTLSGMTRSMQSTFVSAPRSTGKSAFSGRSSFGGGFSGGGFGGGGGGGW